MRKLVLLVCMSVTATGCFIGVDVCHAGVIPSWESQSGKVGFYPISNELSFYKNVDDAGADRGQTLQIISINSFKLLTNFNFEFTGDFNFDYTPDYDNDHYIELSIVKPLTDVVSINVQRVISTFDPESVNQFGLRLVF